MEPVDDLLKELTDSQQKAQLRATYGSQGYPDKNDLDVRTTPILYAAQCGNSGAFSTLLHATRRILKSQVGWIFVQSHHTYIYLHRNS